MSNKAKYKILMLGEGTVGKTTLKHHYLTGSFTNSFTATLGADFATHHFYFEKYDADVTIVIWDVAGQRGQSSIRKTFYSHARGALLLYDVTKKETFDCLKEIWLDSLEKTIHQKPPILLCANKVDLINERIITEQMGLDFVSKMKDIGWDITYIETSALAGQNVNQSFEKLTELILNPGTK